MQIVFQLVLLQPQQAVEIVETFLETKFEGGRHQNR
jgi:ribose 5-phosphate isomerase RpiB